MRETGDTSKQDLLLARISHKLATATANASALTAFRSVGLLNILHEYACGALGRGPCQIGAFTVSLRKPMRKAGLVMADVAGKSIPAALLMATFQASVKAMLTAHPALRQLANGLNHYTCTRSQDGRRFTTAFLAEFDFKTGVMNYINAGHNYPILQRSGGTAERFEIGGLPFGTQPEARYEMGTTTLQPGDLFLLFTDGVIEAVDESGGEYGEPRLLDRLQRITRESADASLKELMTDLDQFVGKARQHDDMTWLVLSIPG